MLVKLAYYIMLLALFKISEIYARVMLVSLNYAPKQQLITYRVTAADHFNKPIIKQCVVTRFPCICSSELINMLLIIFQSMELLKSK